MTHSRQIRNLPDRFKWPNFLRAAAFLLAFSAFVSAFLWYIGVFGGNVRVVSPDRVYRSAELTGPNLDSVLTSRHIRTVLNLRGGSIRDGWYRSEMASCDRRGVKHIDVTLSASKLPTPAALAALLAAFDRAQFPLLLHCQAGADRSGLASTIYLTVYQGVRLDEAERDELTWRYGHFSFGSAHAMDDFFNLYRQTGAGMTLRQWILDRYPAIYAASPQQNG
jgi:hypothetical protein